MNNTHGPTYELEWFPMYPDKFLSSERWAKMKDFQRGWYWELLLRTTRSKPIGYLRLDDGQLWTLAGAHSRQYWDKHAALVLACFKVAEFDGHQWIYNQKLIDVLTEQQAKHSRAVESGRKRKQSNSSHSYSKEFEEIWEQCIWEKVSKKTAAAAFEKAVAELMQQQTGVPKELRNRELAVGQLRQAIIEFAKSDASKADGMFADYHPPYPASWLNGQRYLDDQRTWYVRKPKTEQLPMKQGPVEIPEPTPESVELWNRWKLALTITPHSYDTWIRPLWALAIEDNVLVLLAPSAEFLHVKQRFAQELAASALGVVSEIRIVTVDGIKKR